MAAACIANFFIICAPYTSRAGATILISATDEMRNSQDPVPYTEAHFYGSMIRFIQQKIGSLHGVPLQYSWQVSEVTDAVTAAKNVMKDARTAFSQVAQKKKADRPPKAPASKAKAKAKGA